MLGTNDSKKINWNADEYQKQLATFIDIYKDLPSKPKVYVLAIPPASIDRAEIKDTDVNGNIVSNETVPIIKRVAMSTSVSLIDVNAALKNHLDLFPDGVHPNPEGYKILAHTVYEAISSPNNQNKL